MKKESSFFLFDSTNFVVTVMPFYLVPYRTVGILLKLLYYRIQGEVNVAQEELNTFLSVAEDLRVKVTLKMPPSETFRDKFCKSYGDT
jgi:hypothetical protein